MAARLKLAGDPSVLLAVALVLALVAAPAQPGAASKHPEPSTTPSRFPPLLDCGPAPAAGESDGAFRSELLSLLRGIPSAAAAAPSGFVAAWSGSGTTGRDRAFARALCFGSSAAGGGGPGEGCRACLSAAARDATKGCGASRRAGVWRAGCFLSNADSDALSAREDAFRGWFYADPNTTAAAAATLLNDGVCADDLTAEADCGRCVEDAARAAAALRWLVRLRREEVIVVGYRCCLRVQTSVLPISVMERFVYSSWMMWSAVVAETGLVTGLLLLIIRTLQDIPQPVQ